MADDKKFYWIKLKTDFFDAPTIDWLLEQKNGCEYVVLYQKLCLLTANNDGELSRKIGEMIIPFEPKKIAEVTRFTVDTVVVALELYKRLGLIYEHENGFLRISDFDHMVGSETKWAEKKRLQRGKDRDNVPRLPGGHSEDNQVDTIVDNVPRHVPEMSKNEGDNVRQEIEIEIRDRDRDLEIDTEEEKEGKETPAVAVVTAPDFTRTTFSDEMIGKVEDWLQYKKERREPYKPMGLKSLVTEIQNNVNRYGEQAVMELIDTCMARNYRGIIFDKLQGQQGAVPDTNNVFARLAMRGGSGQ